jgi:hypothetical protein
MATTPVVPAAPVQSWLQRHERIVIVFLALLVTSWGLGKALDARAALTAARATSAEQALVAQKTLDTQNASQILQLSQQYQQLTQTLASQNIQLNASLAQRQASQAAQVAVDTHLSPTDLATRLQTLGNALPEDVSVVSGGRIDLTQAGAVKITQSLEVIAPLQADLKDTTATLQTAQGALVKANEVITGQTKQITGLGLAAVDQDKVCKTQIAAVKAEGRKSKFKLFKLGFILGFGTGAYIGHML